MKKGILWVLTVFCLSVSALASEAPAVSAQSAILMEAESGQVLYEKKADSPRLIASTTKILTALVVLEHCDLREEVVIRPEWTNIEGSSMYLAAGKSYRVEELLYGLMLASGNDAAVALACHAAGSTEAFADWMNEKAQSLGCRNSHFVNPNGLDDAQHYASARDLALITRAALENDAFREIVSSQTATVGDLTYRNHNKLLGLYDGVFGVKTGYTMAAGRSLVSCCERDGMTLICVTLSAPDDWEDHMSLYDWGYENWQRCRLAGNEYVSVPVIGGDSPAAQVLPAGELSVLCRSGDEVSYRYELPRFAFAGFRAGETAGRVVACVHGGGAVRCALVYGEGSGCVEQSLSRWEQICRFLRLAGRNVYSF